MKSKIFFRPLPMALVGLAAALVSGCQTRNRPVAYNTSSTYYSGGSQTGSRHTSGSDVSNTGYAQQGTTQNANSSETVIPLHEETVRVGTREVNAGSVRIRKVVKTETVNQPVQVRRESLVVDRMAPDASAQSNQQGRPGYAQQQGGDLSTPFQENEIVIQLKREEPVVETQIVPTGRIVAQKRATSEQQNIQRQVRREDVEVTKEGTAENVTISENLRTSAKSDSSGAPPSSSAQTQGAGSSRTISDLSQFTAVTDKSTLAGSKVHFSDAKVGKVSGDHLLAIGTDSNSQIWIHTTQAIQGIKEGDSVKVRGSVQSTSQAQSSLGEDATQLQGQPVFIHATTVEKASQ